MPRKYAPHESTSQTYEQKRNTARKGSVKQVRMHDATERAMLDKLLALHNETAVNVLREWMKSKELKV